MTESSKLERTGLRPTKKTRKDFDIDLAFGKLHEDKILDMLENKKIEVKTERDIIFNKGQGTFKLVDPVTSKKGKDFSADSLGTWLDSSVAIYNHMNTNGIDNLVASVGPDSMGREGIDYLKQVQMMIKKC